MTDAEFAATLVATPHPRPFGLGDPRLARLSGVVSLDPADLLATVRVGTPLVELRAALRAAGTDLPVPDLDLGPLASPGPLLADALAWGLPHALEDRGMPWRDLVLGASFALADGTLAKSGARVVKNVTGYDVHRALVGTRHTLAVMTSVHLRLAPAGSVPTLRAEVLRDPAETRTVLRVRPTDLDAAARAVGEGLVARLDGTATLWTALPPERLPALPHRVVWEIHGPFHAPAAEARVLARARSLFDPEGRLSHAGAA